MNTLLSEKKTIMILQLIFSIFFFSHQYIIADDPEAYLRTLRSTPQDSPYTPREFMRMVDRAQGNEAPFNDKQEDKDQETIGSSKPEINLFDELKNFLTENKYQLLIIFSISSIHQIYLKKLKDACKIVKNTNNWSCFKKNIPMEALQEIPEDKLLQELMNVIYRTFPEDKDNPNYDNTEPLYLFVKSAQKEIKRLENFVSLYWYLKLPIISLIFPNLDDELMLAQEKIERLSYMQDLITDKICAMNS